MGLNMPDQLIYANGVNGLTGEYLLTPSSILDLAGWAKQAPKGLVAQRGLRQIGHAICMDTLGLPFNRRPEDVRSAGWAIVFSTEEREEVRAAMGPLIEHRCRQVGDANIKVLEHCPGERWTQWLDRHGTAPGNVVPTAVPYYVLLIGDPSRIPFSFQYLLDVEYAVGRLDFDDANGYTRYVAALIDRESGGSAPRSARAAFFGTRHAFDMSTQLSADRLLAPLVESFRSGGCFAQDIPDYGIDGIVGEQATKATLGELFAGCGPHGPPALLFSATHGIGGWPAGHADQRARHGALLCQDWPGVGQISERHYFAAADLQSSARVGGLVAFLFACYGAGTPQLDAFEHIPGEPAPTIADEPFVAELPKALLSHPGGAALAVVGHVERVWGCSFVSNQGKQLVPFQNAIGRILNGEPVGYAMKDFNERFASLSAHLSDVLESIDFAGRVVPDAELARLWTERNDSQNYILLGDPAAAIPSPRALVS